ncbi:uncharacterized protein FIESC28_09091 [Fusarium coffeatum]|uniref:Heterokaryon incompatibility domain-containing protein n=1 Tax=Fusarium coffeatum TaxID=231269 RepID=A0A366R245_9HYPO|nr:uncharacterized protein FIESC28_09091 [Fusarium coffeatum]RBR11207.1 hypothetical protein FIESC28_09091 [Fusarium coffeatum]
MNYSSEMITSIKEWLSICDNSHTACKDPSNAQSARPTWLIDIQDQCIVQGNAQGRYIALSYTWSDVMGLPKDVEPLQLTISNVHEMKTPGALRKEASKLPNVIKDAMELTSGMGERWLWVDRLCIVQDGPQKKSECMRMDHIYSGAYLTIVAATDYDGRYHDDTVYHISDIDNMAIVPNIIHLYKRLRHSRWAQRAWTYQEYILSKRVVFFLKTDFYSQKTEIFWQCEISIWDQVSLQAYQDKQSSVATLMAATHSTVLRNLGTPVNPDFELYRDVICPYNGRYLSYQEDGLSACLGILNRLEPAFPGGFIFGLPRLYFDHALLWQPLKTPFLCGYFGNQLRRLSTRRPSLPSWAWCGWQCFVDPTSLLKAFSLSQPSDQIFGTNLRTLENLVTWKPAGADGKDRKVLSQRSKPSSSQSNLITARVASACFFSAATLALARWGGQAYDDSFSAFTRASANTVLGEKPLNDLPRVVVVQDHSGLFSGLLRVTGNSTREEGQEMKFIAVSQGRANGRNLNKSFEEKVFRRSRYHDGRPFLPLYDEYERWIGIHVDSPGTVTAHGTYHVTAEGVCKPSFDPPVAVYDDQTVYEFFNVLWVEDGEDGVSYRAGCGYVLKDRWEGMAPIETDITLG